MAPSAPVGNSNSTLTGGDFIANTNGGNSKTSTQKYLINCRSIYSCIYCRTHLANHDELVSRSFQGNHGRAYLFNSVINVSCGPAVQRELNTGSHAVADIFCENCETTLGWKYEKAYVDAQKYKEGKYIIEMAHVVRENRHLEFDKGEMYFGRKSNNNGSSNQARYCQQQQQANRNSLTPPSPSQWSSPPTSSSSNDDEDDLMFVFYDDLCMNQSSYPSSLTSNHLSRIRRSLYLDSTPYDWKNYATSSSSANNIEQNGSNESGASNNDKQQSASSFKYSDLSRSASTTDDSSFFPSSSSSQSELNSSSPEQRPSLTTSLEDTKLDNNAAAAAFDHETQFDFEADDLLPNNSSNNESQIKHCDQKTDSGVNSSFDDHVEPSTSKANNNNNNDDSIGDATCGNPMNLDDEEFYDCYTDHDLISVTNSNSTINNNNNEAA